MLADNGAKSQANTLDVSGIEIIADDPTDIVFSEDLGVHRSSPTTGRYTPCAGIHRACATAIWPPLPQRIQPSPLHLRFGFFIGQVFEAI
jgi:hypothetical protein